MMDLPFHLRSVSFLLLAQISSFFSNSVINDRVNTTVPERQPTVMTVKKQLSILEYNTIFTSIHVSRTAGLFCPLPGKLILNSNHAIINKQSHLQAEPPGNAGRYPESCPYLPDKVGMFLFKFFRDPDNYQWVFLATRRSTRQHRWT